MNVAVVEAIDPLVPGQSYQAIANPEGTVSPIVDRGGNPAATTEADFAAPTQVEQSSPAISYAWRSVSSSKTFGGSYAMEHLEGATASFAFKGKTVTWFTVMGPTQGKAAVWIDGHAKGTFNQYAPSMSFKVARSFDRLAKGDHTITIRVLGQPGGPGATDAQVAVDAIRTGGKVIWNPELGFAWGKAKNTNASGGDVAVSDLARTTATLSFYGTGIDWHTVKGPHQGKAQIYLDGTLLKTVDDFANAPATAVRTVGGLALGEHQLRIVVLGEGRPAARGTQTSIDAFTVIP